MGRKGHYVTVKQHKKNTKSSETKGIAKGDNCHKSDLKVEFCKNSRMYRTDPKRYAEAERIVRELNKK